jgi:hypothetical protein
MIGLALQGNCQTCEVPKSGLDDQSAHATRNKGGVARFTHEACFEGLFPGWAELSADPRPVLARTGLPAKWTTWREGLKKAEKALGTKLTPNSTWIFPHFDCYVQVQLF